MSRGWRLVVHHVFYISASVIAAIAIVSTGVVHSFINTFEGLSYVGSLVAGLFFTSIFTTAPAIIVLGELAQTEPLWVVAFFGALGAVCGDYIIFLIVREKVSRDVAYVIKHAGLRRIKHMFGTRLFHRVMPALGAIVLASPLPDEIGLTLLGLAKVPKERFLLISFLMNMVGILVIGLIARTF